MVLVLVMIRLWYGVDEERPLLFLLLGEVVAMVVALVGVLAMVVVVVLVRDL